MEKTKVAEYKKKWQEKNKSRITEQRKKFREENKEKIKAQKKKYYEEHKDAINSKLRERNRLKKEGKVIPETKVCTECKRELPRDLIHFWKHKNGLTARCKECLGSQFGVYVLNKQGQDEGYRYCTVCRERLPRGSFSMNGNRPSSRCKGCQSKRWKKYYGEHGDKVRARARLGSPERHRQYYLTHKEEYKEGLRKRRKNNPDLYNSYTQKRLALKRNLPSTLTVEQWKQCKKYFDNKCAFCGKKAPLAQEHFIAVTKDGEYSRDNIIPSCGSCNSSKLNHNFFEWYPNYKHYSKQREQKILKYLGYTKGVQQLSLI